MLKVVWTFARHCRVRNTVITGDQNRLVLFCQDFCHGQVMWPPLSALQVKQADPGQSCKQVCQEAQLICEPSFFQHLNKDKDLER